MIANNQLNPLLPDCMCADFAIVSDKPEAALVRGAWLVPMAARRIEARRSVARRIKAQRSAVQRIKPRRSAAQREEEAKVHFCDDVAIKW